jgi:hypothetical protein
LRLGRATARRRTATLTGALRSRPTPRLGTDLDAVHYGPRAGDLLRLRDDAADEQVRARRASIALLDVGVDVEDALDGQGWPSQQCSAAIHVPTSTLPPGAWPGVRHVRAAVQMQASRPGWEPLTVLVLELPTVRLAERVALVAPVEHARVAYASDRRGRFVLHVGVSVIGRRGRATARRVDATSRLAAPSVITRLRGRPAGPRSRSDARHERRPAPRPRAGLRRTRSEPDAPRSQLAAATRS